MKNVLYMIDADTIEIVHTILKRYIDVYRRIKTLEIGLCLTCNLRNESKNRHIHLINFNSSNQ